MFSYVMYSKMQVCILSSTFDYILNCEGLNALVDSAKFCKSMM